VRIPTREGMGIAALVACFLLLVIIVIRVAC
jgi:hypothetical protein